MVLVKDGVSESGTIHDTGAEGKEGSTKHYIQVGYRACLVTIYTKVFFSDLVQKHHQ